MRGEPEYWRGTAISSGTAGITFALSLYYTAVARMVYAWEEKTMGYWRYQEEIQRLQAFREQQRRRTIIAEFFRAYDAARRTSPAFATMPASSPPDTFAQVPACLRVLGLAFPCTAPEVKHAFRARAKVMHPDSGGSNEAFHTLYQAYQEALKLVQ
jgi:hypothetical protein